jgi:glycosyltransferase involved in cell wall biosynthesis
VLVLGTVLGQPMGGVRRHNAELLPRLARLLTERGGSLSVLEGAAPVAFPLPDSVARIATRVPAGPPALRTMFERRALRRALDEAERARRPFDLVHTAHLPMPAGFRVPFTLTIHDLRHLDPAYSSAPRRAIARRVLGDAIDRAASVLTVSDSVRDELANQFAVDRSRVHVVPNAAGHFDPVPRRTPKKPYLLCVGHIELRKNLALVIGALHADPSLPPLVLAGAPKGRERERLRVVAGDLGVEDRIAFLGPFEDSELPRLYAGAACVILPSRIEGFGIAALEAQRARAPLSIARIPSLIEVAGEGVPSFSPEDPIECAHAIRAAMATPAGELDRAAERAARFTWDRSASAWLDACYAALT